jgi:multidrug efflux pump subunit AcrA (membrane-fusion protein)
MARRRVLVISTVVVAVAFAGVGAWYRLERAEPDGVVKAAAAPVPVTVAIASREDLPIYLSGLGVVQASFTVGIRPQVDGKLEQILFKEGQHVRKGEVLAKIDPRLYQAALDNAKAKKAQDGAQLISAQKDLQRSRTLVDKFFETKQVVDQQQAKVDQVLAMVDADQAAIETAQTNLDYTSIVAPSDGRMGVRLIDPGNIVHASTPRIGERGAAIHPGANMTHRPHIRSRSRSCPEIASSQNVSISCSAMPNRRMALLTCPMMRKSSPAPSSLTTISGYLAAIVQHAPIYWWGPRDLTLR